MRWGLSSEEHKLLKNKAGVLRLGFTALLKFFQLESRFPEDAGEIPSEAIRHLALDVGIPAGAWRDCRWESRTIKYHRAEIREWLGFREATVVDAEALETWLSDGILNQEHRPDRLRDAVVSLCRRLCIEPPAAEQIRRLVAAAI